MDLAVRTLREGNSDGDGPLLLLCDALAVIGGPALLRQALADVVLAIAGRRAQATALTLVALERPAAQYQQLCGSSLGTLTVLDCFSDPYGWGGLLAGVPSGDSSPASTGSSSSSSSSSTIPLPSILAAQDGLDRLQRLLSGTQSAGAAQHCIVFDSLSPLIDRFGGPAVVQLLQRLQRSPSTSSLLCGLHTDLHAPQLLAALEQMASGTLQLSAASDLEQTLCAAMHDSTPQGRLSVRLKRRAGRVRVQTQLYCLGSAGSVQFFELPADALNPQAAATEKGQAVAAGNSSAGDAALAQQLAGGMKLGLSAAELEAKQRVQLPFEHQGHAAAYRTGDFRDYLPPEAGGRAARPSSAVGGAAPGAGAGAGSGRGVEKPAVRQGLGHILYVRDSGSEHDSDEDPDDDLDI